MKKKPSILYILILINLFIYMCSDGTSQYKEQDTYAELRNNMVRNQITGRDITDAKVINAMKTVERHLFVSKEYKSQAYNDYPLPIDEGQTISQPYIVALMTEMLDLKGNERILEIGTGSGYQAAILAEIVDSVYTIEIFESLGKKAGQVLTALGYKNVHVKVGDGYQGWVEHAPYDGIIVTCAPTHVPKPLKDQLKEGGRLVIPVGEKYFQYLKIFVKKKGKLQLKETVPVRFVPMIDDSGNAY